MQPNEIQVFARLILLLNELPKEDREYLIRILSVQAQKNTLPTLIEAMEELGGLLPERCQMVIGELRTLFSVVVTKPQPLKEAPRPKETQKEQTSKEYRGGRVVTVLPNGKTLAETAKELGLSKKTLCYRLYYAKMPFEEACTKPLRSNARSTKKEKIKSEKSN